MGWMIVIREAHSAVEHGQTSWTVPPFVANLDFFNRSFRRNDPLLQVKGEAPGDKLIG